MKTNERRAEWGKAGAACRAVKGDSMEKLYQGLKTALGCVAGVFLGMSLYRYWDHRARPDVFAAGSTPWYTGILMNGCFTLGIAAVLLIVLHIVKKKIR